MSLSDQIKNLIRTGKKDGYILEEHLKKCISSFSETDQNYIRNTIEGFKIQIVSSSEDYDELKYLSGKDAIDWVKKMVASGAGEILLTSMDRDGTRDGFELTVTKAITDAVDIPVIASGGVGSLQHLAEGVTLGGADAVLAASIFHFGEYSVGEAKAFMADQGIIVRL